MEVLKFYFEYMKMRRCYSCVCTFGGLVWFMTEGKVSMLHPMCVLHIIVSLTSNTIKISQMTI